MPQEREDADETARWELDKEHTEERQGREDPEETKEFEEQKKRTGER